MENGAETKPNGHGDSKGPPKKVALVALGPSAYDYIRHCDRAGNRRISYDQTWTVNSFCNLIESDLLFHMDDIRVQELRAVKNERVRHMLLAMKEYKNPIITSVPHPDYPNTVPFPLGAVIAKCRSMYFNNTMPYAIAYAILIGVKELHMFGMDYVWPNMAEAEAGRACAEYWIAKAQDAGMITRVAEGSTLMDARTNGGKHILYGYDGFDISLEEEKEPGMYKLKLKDKPLPTAEEIERRYYKDAPRTLEAIIGEDRMKELAAEQEKEQAQ